jgi:hypothetical protein
MTTSDDQSKMVFTWRGAVLGFISYLVVTGIVAAVFMLRGSSL